METLHVDPIACGGHRICAELLPEWIRLDDWGYPIVRRGAVPPELTARAKWAVANCPALALRLRKAGALAAPARVGQQVTAHAVRA